MLLMLSLASLDTRSQENSPYSRYGLGDLTPAQNNLNRAMGGIATAFGDYSTVNFTNPASYAELKITSLDIGLDYTSRTLRALNPPRKFNSSYLIPSYLQLGLPLSKKRNWGMNLGLRPVTRINYEIVKRTRLAGIDSARYSYVGNGGTYQAFTGMAYGTKNLNIGFNFGYMFGNKEYSSQLAFINDTLIYKTANASDTTRFGGLFFNAGIQYKIKLSSKTTLKLGAHGNLETKLNATRNLSRRTVEYSSSAGLTTVDSIYTGQDQKGSILYPTTWGAGFIVEHENTWQFGAELGMAEWSAYRYYGVGDKLQNNWTARLGGQIIPDFKSDNYWKRVAYRLGASFGPDIFNLGTNVPQSGFSFGFGLPVRRNVYTNQYTIINTAFEIGSRGNKSNDIRENIFRLSLGLNLSDIWFNKPKYQ
ncbi:MAG: hypothetical protein RLZZ45_169 [Bacteroidota bacterium]|jgi:hypothetical protein